MQQHNHIARIPKRNLHHARRIFQNPQHPNHGRRINRCSQRLVIKTYVAAGNRRAERSARVFNPINRL